MFGRNKTYVVSYLRDLKDEWNHLGKAMQYWMYFTAIVIICFLGIVTRYIIIYHNDVTKQMVDSHKYQIDPSLIR